ncbi:MAG: hypothetical protein ABJL99_01045 [Aliishimia sp.]
MPDQADFAARIAKIEAKHTVPPTSLMAAEGMVDEHPMSLDIGANGGFNGIKLVLPVAVLFVIAMTIGLFFDQIFATMSGGALPL